MNVYLTLKTIHILSSVIMVGTGFGTAYYLFFVSKNKEIQSIATITRLVVQADWWFTTPTVFIQPATGLAMLYLSGLSLYTPWISLAIGLYIFAGLCWLPVVYLQIAMQKMAVDAQKNQQPLPDLYWRYFRYWCALGYPAFTAMLIIFALMVMKPTTWAFL